MGKDSRHLNNDYDRIGFSYFCQQVKWQSGLSKNHCTIVGWLNPLAVLLGDICLLPETPSKAVQCRQTPEQRFAVSWWSGQLGGVQLGFQNSSDGVYPLQFFTVPMGCLVSIQLSSPQALWFCRWLSLKLPLLQAEQAFVCQPLLTGQALPHDQFGVSHLDLFHLINIFFCIGWGAERRNKPRTNTQIWSIRCRTGGIIPYLD